MAAALSVLVMVMPTEDTAAAEVVLAQLEEEVELVELVGAREVEFVPLLLSSRPRPWSSRRSREEQAETSFASW